MYPVFIEVNAWRPSRQSCSYFENSQLHPCSGRGRQVQCRRSLTSSSRGQRWLLQGHCTELINVPSYVAAVCLMSLITRDHTSPPETHAHHSHTHSESLGLSASTPPQSVSPFSLSFSTPSHHFTSVRDRNSFHVDNTVSEQTGTYIETLIQTQYAAYTCPLSPQIHKQFVQCVYLHISAHVRTHLHTRRERGERSGAQIYVWVLSEWKLLFISHVCWSANQANASVMK